MEVKRIKQIIYGETEERIFVKKGEDKYIFYFYDEVGSMLLFASVKKNGEEISNNWNDTINIARQLGVEATGDEKVYGDDEEDEYEEAVEEAKAWLLD